MVRNRTHIFVRDSPKPDRYRPHPLRIEVKGPPSPADPRGHAVQLKKALEAAAADGLRRRDTSGITVAGAAPGLYVVFEGQRGFGLKLQSLDVQRSGIELVSVTDRDGLEHATVFVPDGKVKHFLRRFEQYAAEKTKSGQRKHKDLVERIVAIRLATLRALWTDDKKVFPAKGEVIWWEVWLRAHDGCEQERLAAFAKEVGVTLGTSRLTFPDRVVVLARGTQDQLSASIDVLNDIAELRKAKETEADFAKMTTLEQAEWVSDLMDRLDAAPFDAPAVCVLDTGVNHAHPLLSTSLAAPDLHAWNPKWGTHDHDGHGTEMAGLALLGNLSAPLLAAHRIGLAHRLESVKILPPKGANPPELYGAITAEAVARVEVQAPRRRRAFSLSIAALAERDRGRPSSWSAATDALAAGRSFDPTKRGLDYLNDSDEGPRRFFVVCAGNVDDTAVDYLSRSDTEAIHDPGQAWNALTVGACTQLDTLDTSDSSLSGWTPLARAGDLSPYSSTSVTFAKQWPIKPDVVFEGGNKAYDGKRALQHDSLCPLTTYFRPQERPLTPTWATSAATAQVARFAGVLAAEYPGMWPETIRALIVHSAEWTPRMLAHLNGARTRGQFERLLLRRFGFGVPDLVRARRSADNALTLIVQDRVRPFDNGKLCEMKVHELPWPKQELHALGSAKVTLRVTLSYFIEPNPARRGWRNRYRYASHGFRFDVMLPTETVAEFKKRVNKMALSEGEAKPGSGSDAAEWRLGPSLRHRGSLHADVWEGTAADLASRGSVGVFPVSGWWKDQPKRDRSHLGARYALVVSIETEETNVDIYTPVAQLVGVPIMIEI
jgi:hypothetical protein